MDWSLTLWTVFVLLRLSLRFVSNVDGFSKLTAAKRMTLLICKLFSNANEYMCSSLKILNITTSAVAYDKPYGASYLVSRSPTAKRKRDLIFLMETYSLS